LSNFATELNIGDPERKKTGWGYRLAALLCAVTMVAAVVVFVVIGKMNEYKNMTIPDFQAAIDSGDYDKAISIYRNVQDEVLAASPQEAANMTEETSMLDDMESIVKTRVDSICTRVLGERYVPSNSDVLFLDSMEELSSSVVSQWLNDLCVQFLLGQLEKPDVIFVFDQLSPISNFSATAKPLLREIDYIETATGDVQNAEASFADEDYISAVQKYQEISEKYDGFVNTYSVERIAEIKDIMYDPMMEEGEHMLDTFRYYSAESLLSDLAVIFPDDERIKTDLLEATGHTTQTQEYYGAVEVLCVRSLIADRNTAFAESYGSNDRGLYLTCDEFTAILNQLYSEGYCLVDGENLAGMGDSSYLVEQNLTIPTGKKPLIIVIENLSYSASDFSCGTCRRLVLNDRGQVCGEYMQTGDNGDDSLVVSRNAEAIGILDSFVEEHPDFTYDGAKGVISVSGFESCFGYVVNEDEVDDRNADLNARNLPSINPSSADIQANCNSVTAIANTLRDTGWKFASCTYGYLADASKCDMATIQSDTDKWKTQIGSLLGETHMLVYPGGNYINGTDERAVYLKNQGFRIFFGIGSRPYYTYGDNYLYFDRAILSGNTLEKIDYSRILDVSTILDPARNSEE